MSTSLLIIQAARDFRLIPPEKHLNHDWQLYSTVIYQRPGSNSQ